MVANITREPNPGQGAYGLRLDGLDTSLLVSPVPESWPRVTVTVDHETPPPTRSSYRDDTVDLSFQGGWGIALSRDAATMTFQVPSRIKADDLVHPFLAPAAMQFATWLGHATFHGGAFVQDGRAYGVFAARNGGKSTTLARLANLETSILTDDLFIVDKSGNAMAGPRCIDLRPEAVTDQIVESVRDDDRRRLKLPQIEPAYPVSGVFVLEWGNGLSVETLTPPERVVALSRNCPAEVARTSAVLELASLPVWRVQRPRDISCLDDVCNRLLQTALV